MRPTTKPDVDNLTKAVLDGMNTIVYSDDKLVVDMAVHKYYGEPRTEIEVTEL